MNGRWRWRLLALIAVLALVAAACSDDDEGGSDTTAAVEEEAAAEEEPATEEEPTEMVDVSLQLQWVAQSQFCGYFAARDQGFYEEEGLNVEILEGAVDIVPQQVLASGGADFGLAWVPKALVSREEGADIINIAQPFQRSGTLEVSWADTGIAAPEDWAGKKVGTWGFGNEFELTAAINAAGITDDVELIQQPFDMSLLLNREVDAAQAMTYNEYAQVLEAVNPDTGELYQPEDLNVVNFNDVGTAMLQDAVWVRADWIEDPANQEIAKSFLKASFKGWIFCRDNPDEAVGVVLAAGPTLGQSHQTWQLNEINDLIWPSPAGIGVMDQALWDQTVEVATSENVIAAPPDEGSFRTDLAEAVIAELEAEGFDVTGDSWTKTTVELVEGGE